MGRLDQNQTRSEYKHREDQTMSKNVPKFKIGDRVIFTNDNGVVFPGKTITGIEYWEGYSEPLYFYKPTDTPWFASREQHFSLERETGR